MPLTIIELVLRLWILLIESMSTEQRTRAWDGWFAFWDGLKPEQQKKFWDTFGDQWLKVFNKEPS